ncbi:MAG TPA: GAF domain-containing protein, partial [Mariniphaga anaerophila]|nr:GAF domain-containing protein [Mariniphaga anaerophila]
NYVYVSQRYLTDYRVKEKDIIGKHHYEVFPDLPEKWRKVHQKALRGIVSKADEDKYIRDDGSIDWTRWECRPWYEANGSIGGIIVYTEVINEQKRKEEEIKKLNQRLKILIESIQQLSAVQSLEKVQDIVVKSARKLIGADGATLVFRENDHCYYMNEDAIQPLWKGKRFPVNECISGWVMQNKKSVVIEDIYSDERILREVYNPTFIKSLAMVPVNINEPIGVIGNYWKKKHTPTETEMQLLQTLADAAARAIENINLYAELEDRVKQRTEQLQAVNKELETFTYSVSHDLKAPLRGIDGYSKLLLDEYGDSLDEDAAHFIKTIRSSTLQMNQLIEDLLSYSRLERSHFKQEKIALKSFVKTLVSNFGEEIKKCGVQVKINIPEVDIVTDSTGLSIALRNFMENAIKFTCKSRNPEIEIGFDENPDYWIMSVKDNGVGFDMKYHERIFEIFQRLHRAEDFPGTGIGLAMVAKALQRMNGKAWAESKPGHGSTFFIELPKIKTI